MNRRKFIKRASGLIVPATFGIFVPKLKAQAFTWRDPAWVAKIRKSSGGSGGTSTAWVTSFTCNATVNTFETFGCKFTVGASNISITDLGVWSNSSMSVIITALVVLLDSSCNAITYGNVTLTPYDDSFHYVTLGSPVTLTAGATYKIECDGGGVPYCPATSVSTTGAATLSNAIFDVGIVAPPSSYNCIDDAANKNYGPVTFKYT